MWREIPRRFRRRLAYKVFLPSLLAAGLATTLGATLLQRRLLADHRQDLHQHGQFLVQILASGVENLSRRSDLERFLGVAGTDRLVQGIWLVNGEPPQVVASSHPGEDGLSLVELVRRRPVLAERGDLSAGRPVQGGLLFQRPLGLTRALKAQGLESSHLLVLVDRRLMEQRRVSLSGQFLLARGGVLVLLLFSLGIVIHRQVLRPLSSLEDQIREGENGAPPEQIELSSEDEVGRLAQTVRRALSDVQVERSRFHLLAERNPGLIYRCRYDEIWTMEYMSRAALELTGHPPEDFIRNARLEYESVIHQDDRDKVREGVARGLAGDRSWDIEYRVVHADGSHRTVREQGRGHVDPDTGEWVLDGIILDQSQRRQEERLTRRLTELEQVRQAGLLTMAGSVAHHFNNLLTGLLCSLELAQLKLDRFSEVSQELKHCQQVGQRAAALSRLMLLYVGEGARELRPLLLGPFVQGHLAGRRRAGRFCPVPEHEGTPDLSRLSGHEELLGELLDRLLENAEDASPDHREQIRLRVGTRLFREDDLPGPRLPLEPDPAGNPFLEIVDQGEGMAPEVLERAFDPFFTTRFTGRGLGLAAVTGIVRLHRGGLYCVSAPGTGTRVLVLFPRHTSG